MVERRKPSPKEPGNIPLGTPLLDALQRAGFHKKEALIVEKFVEGTLQRTKIPNPKSYAEDAMNRGIDRAVRIVRNGMSQEELQAQ